ncbi:MAG TPA: OmpA family protein [Rudaea sp.]
MRNRIVAVCVLLAALSGCQSAPPPVRHEPPPPSPAELRAQALDSLGFDRSEQGWLLRLPDPIWFDFNKASINADMQHNLEGIADDLIKAKIRSLRIEGHTDNTGPRDYNVELSRKRAEAVAQTFIAHGFEDAKIERVAYGPDRPVAPNDTRDGRALNRRVEIIVPTKAVEEP